MRAHAKSESGRPIGKVAISAEQQEMETAKNRTDPYDPEHVPC
jgi:hypothetical protein